MYQYLKELLTTTYNSAVVATKVVPHFSGSQATLATFTLSHFRFCFLSCIISSLFSSYHSSNTL